MVSCLSDLKIEFDPRNERIVLEFTGCFAIIEAMKCRSNGAWL